MIDASLSEGGGEVPQGQLAGHLRCRILAEEERFDEALAEATEGIRSSQEARQARAVQLFEANRARQLLQLGQLADAAAALEGRLSILPLFPLGPADDPQLVRIAVASGDRELAEWAAAAEAAVILEAGQRRLAAASALQDLALAEIRARRSRQAIKRTGPCLRYSCCLRGAQGPGPGPHAAAAPRPPGETERGGVIEAGTL